MAEVAKVHRPEVEVLGLYSPSANREEYERFIRAYVDDRDPANFGEDTRAVFRRLGRESELTPFDATTRKTVEEEMRWNLANAVYVEAMVAHPDERFDVAEFSQPDPKEPKGRWQVAWNEKYLTEDGETLLDGSPLPKVPSVPRFRIVFVIHFWKPHLPLVCSYGPLQCPLMQPLPSRLWRLAPYEIPD